MAPRSQSSGTDELHDWVQRLQLLFDREEKLLAELANVRNQIDRAFMERTNHVEADE